MTTIKRTGCAALIACMLAGSANAWPVSEWSWSADKFLGSNIGGGGVGANLTIGNVIGGTFAAWTVYRFFQNCGPFRCNS